MKIYPTNKIPQWAIKSSMDGALQPSDDAQKHPDLVVNKKFASAVNAPNVKTAKTSEQVAKDIEMMKAASPSLRLLDDEVQIKKASVNSKKAILDSQGTRNSVHMIREPENTKISNSKYAGIIPGGISMFNQDNELMQKLSDISDISREANKQKLMRQAKYHDRRLQTSEQVAEEQKARKIGEMNELSGMYTAQFASSKMANPTEPQTLPNLFAAIKGTMPNLNGEMSVVQRTMANEISKYQLAKLEHERKDRKDDWKTAAVKEITERVTKATKSADAHVANQRQQMSAPKTVPNVDDIKTAFAQKTITDTKAENIAKAAKKANSIKKTASKKEQIKQSGVSRPKTTLAEKVVEVVNLKKLQEKVSKMQGF
jgi:hypothetical protein